MKEVKVKVGDDIVDGFLNQDELTVDNGHGIKFKLGGKIIIDGKSHDVQSTSVSARDNILIIKLAMASPPQEKSDDKPIKGTD